jgi:phosphoglucomutase
VLAANGVQVGSTRATGRPRPRPSPTPSSSGTGTGASTWPTASSVTPSHNPPEDGGFKYNPPNGGPADTDITGWVQDEANRLLRAGLDGVRRVPAGQAAAPPGRGALRLRGRLRRRPGAIVDLEAVRGAGLHLGVDPLGGAAVDYWSAIAERYRPEP